MTLKLWLKILPSSDTLTYRKILLYIFRGGGYNDLRKIGYFFRLLWDTDVPLGPSKVCFSYTYQIDWMRPGIQEWADQDSLITWFLIIRCALLKWEKVIWSLHGICLHVDQSANRDLSFQGRAANNKTLTNKRAMGQIDIGVPRISKEQDRPNIFFWLS